MLWIPKHFQNPHGAPPPYPHPPSPRRPVAPREEPVEQANRGKLSSQLDSPGRCCHGNPPLTGTNPAAGFSVALNLA